jgi:predicted DNA-binding transcriptional regulator YafY
MQRAPSVQNGQPDSATEVEPHLPSLRLPLARLLQLVTLLQCGRFPNARRLAEACAVSRRTIYRDLTTLETAGISVLYHPDRQGYQVARECLLQPTQLDDKEALALLLMTRLAGDGDSFGLSIAAERAVAKVVQALPGEKRSRITSWADLIASDASPVRCPPDHDATYELILSALVQRKRLRLWCRDHDHHAGATTKLGLYRLAWIDRHWSLVGHSSADRAIRSFDVGRIERAELTDESYSIPPRFRLDRFLRKSPVGPSSRPLQVQLRFTPSAAAAVRASPRRASGTLTVRPDGGLDLFLKIERLDDVLPWLTEFGDAVELLKPDELRSEVRTWAERIARTHATAEKGVKSD